MRALFTLIAITLFSALLHAQKPAAKPGPAASTPSPATATASPAAVPPAAVGPVEDYSYQPDSRRDPFLSLVGTGNDLKTANRKGDGLAGFGVSEISVRGIMQSRGAFVAMIQGPDNKTYIIHQGDKLADGVVKNVTPQGLVVLQDISDPLANQKQREVRKLLRSLEDAKERL